MQYIKTESVFLMGAVTVILISVMIVLGIFQYKLTPKSKNRRRRIRRRFGKRVYKIVAAIGAVLYEILFLNEASPIIEAFDRLLAPYDSIAYAPMCVLVMAFFIAIVFFSLLVAVGSLCGSLRRLYLKKRK